MNSVYHYLLQLACYAILHGIDYRNQDIPMPNNSSTKNRGIFLLPNLLTTAGLFSGFFAIVASMNNQFESAAIAIFIAMVFDGLDGRVARMTNTQSDFGAEYDSMADIVSFGMALKTGHVQLGII